MNIRLRPELKLKNKLVIIKLSSLAVTHEHGGLNLEQIKAIVNDIDQLINSLKLNVIIVSSGAVNAGRKFITHTEKHNMTDLQACSAVGQPILMHAFQEQFKTHNLQAAQVLLTHEDLKNKLRSHNIRGSILCLLKNGIIPILNENDSVSFDEITVGDNDQLSAMIGETMSADLLCMLTKADGLYNKDPNEVDAQHFPVIDFQDGLAGFSTITKSSAGRGGMKTKLQAVRKLTPLGIHVLIGSYCQNLPILRLLTTEQGTLFLADPQESKSKKKSWILTRVRNHATIKIDQGAVQALL
ncbi:MAG: glutamate 5-kinase, partial [Flavobacteriaceae bacterium]|nr:glutamate 5-kinase [Flavobacteriaceae bacterium]